MVAASRVPGISRTPPSGWPGMDTYTERRRATARLRASAAIVATRKGHGDPLAAWLDDLATQVAPPRTDDQHDHDQEDTP